MAKYLITGGLGFIGHNVVQQLERLGHTCLIVDSCTNYGIIPDKEIRFLVSQRKKKVSSPIQTFDIRNKRRLQNTINSFKPDTVIHLASFPRQKVVLSDPEPGSEVMVTALLNLLEASVAASVEKFVYISSSMVYGNFSCIVPEEYPCSPIGSYAIMKYTGEQLVRDYSRQYNIEHTIIRPSAVYGELDVNDRVIAKFIQQALVGATLVVKGADEVLDFTYVDDIANGIVLAATSKVANGKTYNMTRCDTHTATLLDAATLITDIVGSGKISVCPKDSNFPSRNKLSISKAKIDLGYNPTTNILEGFTRYAEWLRKNPILWS